MTDWQAKSPSKDKRKKNTSLENHAKQWLAKILFQIIVNYETTGIPNFLTKGMCGLSEYRKAYSIPYEHKIIKFRNDHFRHELEPDKFQIQNTSPFVTKGPV